MLRPIPLAVTWSAFRRSQTLVGERAWNGDSFARALDTAPASGGRSRGIRNGLEIVADGRSALPNRPVSVNKVQVQIVPGQRRHRRQVDGEWCCVANAVALARPPIVIIVFTSPRASPLTYALHTGLIEETVWGVGEGGWRHL